ncbi:MAG TPA: indolepyruvate oxidoreductase subunit beta family protein [Bryobacteraceae bacterium]|nr:indolepyruvate oxidoreductase subunit beta family protein [Bryobacteraceae bacterium]
MPPRAITIAILAMGGEGGGVLADWIVDLAEHGGYYAQTTSVPGVAQRTGSTIYYIELFPEAAVRAAGKDPVLALMPVPGEVDIVVASELMEAGRAVQRNLVTPDRTTLIASTHRVYSMTERTAIGDGRVDAESLLEGIRAAAKRLVAADFAEIARDCGSVISAALFGALAATEALPFPRERFQDAIRRGGVGVDASLRAFERSGEVRARDLPVPDPDVIRSAVERLADYQDKRYAEEYLELLQPIRTADRDGTLLRETARYLALWMSYEDAIRVADLKVRAARFGRVHREVKAGPGQLVRIHEFLHPRVGEFADILPASLGRWLLATRWATSMVARLAGHGKVVETTSIRGFLQLYLLACLRPMRRRSLRFVREQEQIRQWLALIPPLAAENYALACEVAECPRLLKGYGDTHERGVRNFVAVMQALPQLRSCNDAAARLKKLREAAMADESGQKLAEELACAAAH